MRTVDVKTLQAGLDEYLRAARAGETVLVTDGGRVVAELGPPRPGRAPNVDDAMLADLVRSGILRPPLVRVGDPPPRRPMVPLAELLVELDGERGSR